MTRDKGIQYQALPFTQQIASSDEGKFTLTCDGIVCSFSFPGLRSFNQQVRKSSPCCTKIYIFSYENENNS
jgi:hypothetical protein